MGAIKMQVIVATSFFMITIIVLLIISYCKTKEKSKEKYLVSTGNMGNIVYDVPESKDFYIYNYYKIPIDVGVVEKDKEKPIIFVTKIQPKQKKGISMREAELYMKPENDIMIYESIDENDDNINLNYNDLLLGKAKLHFPKDKIIRAIHAGLNVGKSDFSVLSDPVKSPLGGTTIPRLRIVNTLCRPLRLYTVAGDGGSDIIVKPGKSILYFGQWNNNGLPLGVTIKDRDGILQDYKIRYPITDLFMGLTSDQAEPFYDESQIGNEFDDTVTVPNYPLQINHIQFHKGSLIDRSYIPLNW